MTVEASANKIQAWFKTLPLWKRFAVLWALMLPAVIVADHVWEAVNKKIDTPSACVSHIQGVWTFTQPLAGRYAEQPFWERYDFTKTGVQVQTAYPSETEWGNPTVYGYSADMKKTADSGTWYCHVNIEGTALKVAVFQDGDVRAFKPLSPDMPYLLLQKRDKQLGR
jgi:hypothetical protein